MKNFVSTWNKTPYWLRGWFLGNLIYVFVAILSLRSDFMTFLYVWPAFLVESSHSPYLNLLFPHFF
jgi:hypothetical protein